MPIFLIVKAVHIISATTLLGTGAGIAFFMVMAHRTRDPKLIAHTAEIVVLADFLFTASAVVIQPITGFWLAKLGGYPVSSGWVAASLSLYVFTGACWLPVVGIQMRLRKLARAAANREKPLPKLYDQLFRVWFVLGFPAFGAVLAIIWLMVAKPSF
jgi:uncharacterized membrane protein